MKKKLYYWACELSPNKGEGILANSYLKNIKKYNPNYKLININKKINLKKKSIFYNSYIMPILGILYIYKYSLRGQRTCFINYLPLWNFIIFLMLPKKTLLGPITGTISSRKFFLLIKFLQEISIKIIIIKYNTILLATEFFKNSFKNKKVFFNFILNEFKTSKIKVKKEFDFIFYCRNYSTKGNEFLIQLINKLVLSKKKVAIIGEKIIINKNVTNFKYLNRKKTKKLISKARFSLASKENLYSYFVQDCLSNNLIVFYSNFYNKFATTKSENLVPIDYDNFKYSFSKILNIVKNQNKVIKINKSEKLKMKNFNFYNYFYKCLENCH